MDRNKLNERLEAIGQKIDKLAADSEQTVVDSIMKEVSNYEYE